MSFITRENYFSLENTKKYFGSSQFKDFMKCPAMAMAIINGDYKIQSDAFLQGAYIDAHFEGTLDFFKAKHFELFKKNGEEYKKYEKLTECINFIENDPIMNKLCTGEQQVIMTGKIEGVPFKIMIDSLLPDRIVDRKCMADFKDKWSEEQCEYVPWWKVYRYDIQAAIYQEIYRQNTGEKLPFELVAISKERTPDKAWVRFNDYTLKTALEEVRYNIEEFNLIKQGVLDAKECGKCDWCKSQKMLTTYEEV